MLTSAQINDMRSSPVDVKPEPNAAGLLPGDEVIDSDLDDSEGELDDDDDGGDDADVDYVFCVYDKVGIQGQLRIGNRLLMPRCNV